MDRIEPQKKHREKVKIWVDESIWGHRFYDDQTPWLVLLEFLCLFESRRSEEKSFVVDPDGDAHEEFKYKVPRRIPLRKLIFSNPYLRHVEEDGDLSESAKWSKWLKLFSDPHEYEYDFLKENFQDFRKLVQIVEFYQATSVEPHNNRRWSSKFIYPYEAKSLYADLPANPKRPPDRRFFARGGELLYLMLNRSGLGEEVSEKISNKLLSGDVSKPWNGLINYLLHPDRDSPEKDDVEIPIGYLPFRKRAEYRELAETWLHLLSLDIPGEAVMDPLMRLTALHMLLYMIRRSNEEIGNNHEPRIVLEIASPRKTLLLELSKKSYAFNRNVSYEAVRAYIEKVKECKKWLNAQNEPNPSVAIKEILKDRFCLSKEYCKDLSGDTPDAMLSTLVEDAKSRHKQHVAQVHREWSKHIGLSVGKRGIGTWYSPDDSFLKALVMRLVTDEREEYHSFLAKLYEKFKIVIGVTEAETAYDGLPIDQNALMLNAQRLEHRLKTLGLLRRLSDDCAYVENPFWREK